MLRIGVVGDFFLDSYRECDPALDEKSLETGKTCYQVIGYRRQPGAAGNVAANLRALGVGAVEAVGYCGDDGEGYELRRAMRQLGLDLTGFFTAPGRLTPTYDKPCYVDSSQRGRSVIEELERLDTKNRRPTPANLQNDLIAYVRQRLNQWDGLVLIDQVAEANCGVLTTRVRRAIAAALGSQPKLVVPRRFAHPYWALYARHPQTQPTRGLGRAWRSRELVAQGRAPPRPRTQQTILVARYF